MSDRDRIKQLNKLFDQERTCLLGGDITALGPLAEKKEALMHALGESPVVRAALPELRRRAEANAGLAKAAGEGLRDAIRRLETLRKAAGPIGSYAADGRAAKIGSDIPTLERKA